MDIDDLINSTKELLKVEKDIKDHERKIVNDFLEQCRLRRTDLRLVKRYLGNELRFHMHITLARRVQENAVNLCAVIEHGLKKGVGVAHRVEEGHVSVNTGDGGIQAMVLVDVREFDQQPQGVMPVIPSIVRLQALDVCVGTVGNPIRNPDVLSVYRKTPLRAIRNIREKRELAGAENILRQRPDQIPLDEFEEKVIQGRPEMIDHFACEDRQFKRRISEDAQLLCAIRITDDFERIVASIFGDAILEGIMMFDDPDDFGLGGFECLGHGSE